VELRLGKRVLDLDRPRVMGILNVTPDSFSDGGSFRVPEAALTRAERMLHEGADIIDVGGESTRPGAEEVSEQEELDRVMPVIEGIANRLDLPISIDTSKPEVMREAVRAGAAMINDVYALRQAGALEAAAEADAVVCLMHMQGTPRTMQEAPAYDRLPGDVIDFLAERVAACTSAGISRARLVLDPGFGFGKTDEHNLVLLATLRQIADLGLPLLVGLSRKRTLGNLSGNFTGDRLAAGIAAAVIAVSSGAHIVRTHDVAPTVDALAVAHAVARSGRKR
jgi:dihydropteroate synthase